MCADWYDAMLAVRARNVWNTQRFSKSGPGTTVPPETTLWITSQHKALRFFSMVMASIAEETREAAEQRMEEKGNTTTDKLRSTYLTYQNSNGERDSDLKTS